MLDYIVVGLGLAGTSFCETLRKKGKSFLVINNRSQVASRVAGGIINPIILKRFTLSWRADEQLPIALKFYHEMEGFLNVKLLENRSVLRVFASVEEQNLWFEAADQPLLKPFLDLELISNHNKEVNAPLKYGRVLQTWRLDTQKMLNAYEEWLYSDNKLQFDTFDYEALKMGSEYLEYKGIRAKQIVFSEGFGLKRNPFFNYLPLQGSKGEYLTINTASLKEENMLKSSIFLIPLGNDLYKVGATYNRDEKNNLVTESAKNILLKKTNQLLNASFKLTNHEAGVRPTVKDRRPLLGKHPKQERLWLLNGFGSHGILIGPWASQYLYLSLIHISEPTRPY